MIARLILPLLGVVGARRAYRLVTAGAITIDTGIGRRVRPLGPVSWRIAASRETVFDVIAAPYLGRTPRALEEKLNVWERGADMVLAAHHTQVKCGKATTVETVKFTRPERIDFRVVRGPVPHVIESFILTAHDGETELVWEGELGTDFGALGERWGDVVARSWKRAVHESIGAITQEAERLEAHEHPASTPGEPLDAHPTEATREDVQCLLDEGAWPECQRSGSSPPRLASRPSSTRRSLP